MSRFVQVDRDTAYLLPPSVQAWLPEGHLARYVVDVVEALDLSALARQYAGRGSDAHHPGTLLGLLIYGYATGVHASRVIERQHKADEPDAARLNEQIEPLNNPFTACRLGANQSDNLWIHTHRS